MNETYRKAFKEAYIILQYLDRKQYKKIPKITIKTIKNNMDLEYNYEVNENFELEEQDMLPETKALLYNIYRDYLTDPERREEILKKQKEERIEREKKKKEKNDPAKLFVDKEKERVVIPAPLQDAKPEGEVVSHKLPMQIEASEEKGFRKIINRIKRALKLI